MPVHMPMEYKPKATIHRRKLNAARIARYRARLRNGQSVFKVEGNKADIILALRGLAHSAGMHEFMLTPEASHEEIEEKLSMLIGQITDRWRDYFNMKGRDSAKLNRPSRPCSEVVNLFMWQRLGSSHTYVMTHHQRSHRVPSISTILNGWLRELMRRAGNKRSCDKHPFADLNRTQASTKSADLSLTSTPNYNSYLLACSRLDRAASISAIVLRSNSSGVLCQIRINRGRNAF